MKKITYPQLPILIVDDEEDALYSMETALRTGGINNVICLSDSREVIPHFANNMVGVMLLDLSMPNISGMDILKEISGDYPDIPIIIVTGHNEITMAVDCMKVGAFDYFVKPIDKNRVITCVQKAISYRELHMEYTELRERFFTGKLDNPDAFSGIITHNQKMKMIFQYIEAISGTNKPVLITGETGVGKELIARAIHKSSAREGAFVSENVSGITEEMFPDVFFGHVKGAYTGASNPRKGLIEQAKDGTLFLDEIGDLNPDSQVKLLRLIQENVYRPIGSDLPRRTNARIIAATNCNLEDLIEQDKFRKDLYYRFKTHNIHIPPLRERLDDLPLLLDFFLNSAARELDKKTPTPPPELLTLLNSYHFPGNIRELEAMVFNAVSNHKSKKLSMVLFKDAIGQKDIISPDSYKQCSLSIDGRFPTLKEAQKYLLDEALTMADNNLSIAAGLLGISRQALSKRLKRMDDK